MRAEGSSLHLKQEFGLGYTLVVARESHQTLTAPIVAFVSKYLESGSAEVVSDHLTELALQLPLCDISRFPSLLRGCDAHAAELGVTHFVLGMTTLEDVFLRLENEKVTRSESRESRESNHDLGRSFEERRARYRLDRQDRPLNLQRKGGRKGCVKHQVVTLLRKRALETARDPSRVVVLMMASLVMCALAAMLLGTLHYEDPGCAAYVKQSPLLELSLKHLYGGGVYGARNADTSSSSVKLPMQSLLYAKFQADAALASMIPAAAELLDAGDSCAEVNTSVLQNRENVLGAFCAPSASGGPRSSGLVMYNAFSGAHLLPALFSLWDAAQSSGTESTHSQVYSQPWPQSALLSKSGETSIQSMLVFSLVLVLAWSLLPAAAVAPIIKERAEGVYRHLRLSGMSVQAYWLSHFLHDYLLYLVQCALLFPILYLLPGSRAAFCSSGAQAGATICMFLLHGVDSTLFNYYWTSHSKNYATSFGSCMSSACGPFFFYSIAATTLITLQVSGAIAAGTVSNFNTVFFAFSPFSALAFALWSIANAAQIRCPGMRYFDFEATGLPLLYMVGRVLVVTKLLMRVDKQSPFAKHLAAKEVDPAVCAQEEDADVHAMRRQTLELARNAREEEYQEDGASRPPPRLLMWGIRKEYLPTKNSTGATGVKVAVHNLSLHLRRGECLGLLGPNGAGKTTTLSMIVGDVEPSCGNIQIGDERNLFDVSTQRAEAQNMLGLCPQFDVLTHSLTVEEHLTLHGQLKNLPEGELRLQTEELLARLDLSKYRGRYAGALSGGNKRKLSLGIALIGDPAVVMLDEPSTGMVSRL
jgi:ATP-binding cassette subfamily A (ABC1) protein 1